PRRRRLSHAEVALLVFPILPSHESRIAELCQPRLARPGPLTACRRSDRERLTRPLALLTVLRFAYASREIGCAGGAKRNCGRPRRPAVCRRRGGASRPLALGAGRRAPTRSAKCDHRHPRSLPPPPLPAEGASELSMCGIAGVFYADPARTVEPGLLEAMGCAIAHRGPDGAGLWREPG